VQHTCWRVFFIPLIARVFLFVLEAKARIKGPTDLFVKTGSVVRLSCVISQGPHDLGTVFWYKDGFIIMVCYTYIQSKLCFSLLFEFGTVAPCVSYQIKHSNRKIPTFIVLNPRCRLDVEIGKALKSFTNCMIPVWFLFLGSVVGVM